MVDGAAEQLLLLCHSMCDVCTCWQMVGGLDHVWVVSLVVDRAGCQALPWKLRVRGAFGSPSESTDSLLRNMCIHPCYK